LCVVVISQSSQVFSVLYLHTLMTRDGTDSQGYQTISWMS